MVVEGIVTKASDCASGLPAASIAFFSSNGKVIGDIVCESPRGENVLEVTMTITKGQFDNFVNMFLFDILRTRLTVARVGRAGRIPYGAKLEFKRDYISCTKPRWPSSSIDNRLPPILHVSELCYVFIRPKKVFLILTLHFFGMLQKRLSIYQSPEDCQK
jgi:hypothetical protein